MEVRTTVELEKVGALLEGRHENPFEILGPHAVEKSGRPAVAVRAYLPHSQQAWVIHPKHGGMVQSQPMRRIHPAGLYEAICPAEENKVASDYLLKVVDQRGEQSTMHDPYAFPPLLTEYDL